MAGHWNRLRVDWLMNEAASVCHETIYRFAYSNDGQAMKLWRYLPESFARRPRVMPDVATAADSARISAFGTVRTSITIASNLAIGNAI